MDREYLKTMAKNQIRDNIGILFGIALLTELITQAASLLLGWIGPTGGSCCCIYFPILLLK